MSTTVTLAYPYRDDKGVTHKPDTTLSLADDVAAQLLADGFARPAASAAVARPRRTPAAAPRQPRASSKAAAPAPTPAVPETAAPLTDNEEN